MKKLLITNIKELVTLRGVAKKEGRNPLTKDLSVIKNASLFINNGRIEWLGKNSEGKRKFSSAKKHNAQDAVVFPGLVDPHTHLIFAGSRHHEFAWRCEGQAYLDIAKKGGGILSSLKTTQKATLAELVKLGRQRVQRARSFGVTTLEVKSGYGLSHKDEIKCLKAIRKINTLEPTRLVPTFLGAHAFPEKYKNKPDAYVDLICKKMIPDISKKRLAQFCDVFIDTGFFNLKQTHRILETARQYNLKIRIHSDEFKALGGTELAVQLGAHSVDHLISIGRRGIRSLTKSDTVATVLPGTSFFLGKPFAPARKLIDAGIVVAIGTDFNPGSCVTQNLPLVGTIATTQMKLTIPEVIAAITYNAAKSLGLENEIGSIERGKRADLAFFDIPSYEYLLYHFGDNFCRGTIVSGKRVEYDPDTLF